MRRWTSVCKICKCRIDLAARAALRTLSSDPSPGHRLYFRSVVSQRSRIDHSTAIQATAAPASAQDFQSFLQFSSPADRWTPVGCCQGAAQAGDRPVGPGPSATINRGAACGPQPLPSGLPTVRRKHGSPSPHPSVPPQLGSRIVFYPLPSGIHRLRFSPSTQPVSFRPGECAQRPRKPQATHC